MMHPRYILALLPLLLASPAHADPNCASLMSGITQANSPNTKLADIEWCHQRGWEVPPTLRPANGQGWQRTGGENFSVTGVQPPDQPPAVAGAAPSVSQAKISFSLSFPPWSGFPCQLPGGINICGSSATKNTSATNGSTSVAVGATTSTGTSSGTGTSGSSTGTGTGTDACPVRDDTTGTFGAISTMSSSGSYALACGGAIPLSTYQATLVASPTGMAVTEYGSPYLWVYSASSGGYTGGTALPLPTYLCKADATGTMQQSITLTAPRAQAVEYNAGTSAIAIRLIPGSAGTDGSVSATDLNAALAPSANSEQYLIIPIKGGVPQVPANCANQATYYQAASAIGGDMVIETPLTDGCEGSADACKQAGVSVAPSVTTSCDAVTVYLSGTYNTTQGQVNCTGMTQLMVVDRPTLALPPNSSAAYTSVTGRTAVMVTTADNSRVYLPSGNIVRLPRSGKSFTFPEGATLGTDQGQVVMNGPATINTATGQVVMNAGGSYIGTDGSTLASYASGSAITPNIAFPWLLSATRNVTLPRSYQLLTQPSPYVRAPVQTQ